MKKHKESSIDTRSPIPEVMGNSLSIELFSPDQLLMVYESDTFSQIHELDFIRYGREATDPFYLGLDDSKPFSTHIAVASEDEQVIGALALTLRENPKESIQLRWTINRLARVIPGCSERLNKLARMVYITNMVSSKPGTARQLIAKIHQDLKPTIFVGYTRNERVIAALKEALAPKGFFIYLAGASIEDEYPESVFAFLYNQSVAWYMENRLGLNQGLIPFRREEAAALGGTVIPEAIIYPTPLRGKFVIEGMLERVAKMLAITSRLKAKHQDPYQDITLLFTAIHPAIYHIQRIKPSGRRRLG